MRYLRDAPWTLWLTIAVALWLFRAWYFSAGYLTFGDLPVPHSGTILPQAFQMWNVTERFGSPDSTHILVRYFFGMLFRLHVPEPIAERIIWFYLAPPLLIAGSYLLAKVLTGDRLAAGVVSLATILSPDFLVRAIGGHASALIPIALAPWALLAMIQIVEGRNRAWLGVLSMALFASSGYDSRWALATFALVIVLGAALTLRDLRGRCGWFGALVMAAIVGLVTANLPWLLPVLFTSSGTPELPQANFDPAWVQKLSLATLTDSLAGWNPSLANDFLGSPFMIRHVAWPGYLFIGIVLSLAVSVKRWIMLALFVCYLGGALLFKGSQPPFGEIYFWLFQHVPLFNLYREPLKFGSTVSLCAALIIGLGLGSLRGNKLRHLGGVTIACVVLIGLSSHAFGNVGGTLKSREPPRSYAPLAMLLARDATFGRVLWIPQTSRWGMASPIHPFVDAAAAGNLDWAPFLRDKPGRENGLSYATSPLFFDLLQWNGIRYVVMDQDTEEDATFRSVSFPIKKIRSELTSDGRFRHIATFGALSVYEVISSFRPPVWSTDFAAGAYGTPNAMNAGAVLNAFSRGAPIILQNDIPKNVPLAERYVFDSLINRGARLKGLVEHRVEWFAAADSLDAGPQRGDAVIAQAGPPAGRWDVRMAYGRSTVALDPLLGTLAPTALRRVSQMPRGEILQRGDSPAVSIKLGAKAYDGRPLSLPFALTLLNEFPTSIEARFHVLLTNGSVIVDVGSLRHNIAAPGGTFLLKADLGATILQFHRSGFGTKTVNVFVEGLYSARTLDLHVRGAQLDIAPTPLAEAPSVEVIADPLGGLVRNLSLILKLHDPVTRQEFLLLGPEYAKDSVPRGELNIREWLARTAAFKEEHFSLLTGDDVTERLQLTGVGLLANSSLLPFKKALPRVAIKVKAINADGYTVRSAVSLPSSDFSCVRCKKFAVHNGTVFTINYRAHAHKPTSWVGSFVAIDASSGAETGLVTSQSSNIIRGITWLGTGFSVKRKAIRIIQDASDAVVIGLSHQMLQPFGTFYLRVETARKGLRFKLAADVDGGNSGSVLIDPLPAVIGTAIPVQVWRVNLFPLVTGSGNRTISSLRLMVQTPNLNEKNAQVRLSDALIINGGRNDTLSPTVRRGQQILRSGVSYLGPGNVRASLGTGFVPLVTEFSRGQPVRYETFSHAAIPSSRLSIIDRTHNHWLMFSQSFDPGWSLLDANRHPCGVHLRVYGTVNGWYVPKGLNGRYSIEYIPEGPARTGTWLALLGFAGSFWLSWASFRNKAEPKLRAM